MLAFTFIFTFVLLLVPAEQLLGAPAKAEPVKNVEYIFKGYDILFGSPYPTKTNVDPGYRQQIFQVVNNGKTTGNGKYLVPDGVSVSDCEGSCSYSSKTTTITGAKSYRRELNQATSASLKGWGASFAGSGDYNSVEQMTSNNKDVFTLTRATCCVYTVTHNSGSSGAPLESGFIEAVKSLPPKYEEWAFSVFVQKYGTHYLMNLNMGALFGQQSRFTSEKYKEMSNSGLKIKVAAEYNAKANVTVDSTTDIKKEQADEFANSAESMETITLGAKAPKGATAHEWMNIVAKAPMPIFTSFLPIQHLLDFSVFGSQYGISEADLNARKVALSQYLNKYCQFMIDEDKIHVPCSGPPPDASPYKHYKEYSGWATLNKNGHVIEKTCTKYEDGRGISKLNAISEGWYGIVDIEIICDGGETIKFTYGKGKNDKNQQVASVNGFNGLEVHEKSWHGVVNMKMRDMEEGWRPLSGGSRDKHWIKLVECPQPMRAVGLRVNEQDRFGLVDMELVCYPTGKKCADEGQTCKCTGEVRYGSGGTWSTWQLIDEDVVCTEGYFGNPGGSGNKMCYCRPIPRKNEWKEEKKCADEWKKCKCDGQMRFGAEGRYTPWKDVHGSTDCNHKVLGDPYKFKTKHCYCRARAVEEEIAIAESEEFLPEGDRYEHLEEQSALGILDVDSPFIVALAMFGGSVVLYHLTLLCRKTEYTNMSEQFEEC